LSTLGKQEIAELAKSGEVLDISCDYCTKQYGISPAKLQGLLDES
jgi:redox-regulated HSP33 family molecular chaperone